MRGRALTWLLLPLVMAVGPGCDDREPTARPPVAASAVPPRDPPSSETDFRRLLLERDIDVVHMTPATGISTMLEFQHTARFAVLPGGDALRVTWTDGSSAKAQPTLTLSRELSWTMRNPGARVERWALWMTWTFPPGGTPVPRGDGTRICTGEHASDECSALIRGLPLYRAVANRTDGEVQIGFDPTEDRR